jgi:small ligand-binding sensory domain FIST
MPVMAKMSSWMRNRATSVWVEGPFDEAKVREAAINARHQLGGSATCAFVFASTDYLDHLNDFVETLQLNGHVPEIIGSTAGGLITSGHEIENRQGFSALFLNLNPYQPIITEISSDLVQQSYGPEFWYELTGVRPGEVNGWLAFADPFKFGINPWLREWNPAYEGIPTVGGLASGQNMEDLAVFRNHEILSGGCILVGLTGSMGLRAAVSQGCRPIGQPLTVTKVENNIVYSLGSQ